MEDFYWKILTTSDFYTFAIAILFIWWVFSFFLTKLGDCNTASGYPLWLKVIASVLVATAFSAALITLNSSHYFALSKAELTELGKELDECTKSKLVALNTEITIFDVRVAKFECENSNEVKEAFGIAG